jgi:hypothetical protein
MTPKITRVPEGTIPDIVGAIVEHRTETAQAFPVRSTHASKIGHPCRRFLVYQRVAWDLLPKPDARLMGIFRRGRLIGDDIAVEAKEALKKKGLNVIEQEVHIPPNEFDIGGKVDFALEVPINVGRPIVLPVEAKSMNDHVADKLPDDDDEAIAELRNHDQAYMRCYPSQLMTYLHFRQIAAGLIFIRTPSTFSDRQIILRYDPEWAQELLNVAQDVKDRVAKIEAKRKAGKTDGDFLEAADEHLPDRVDFTPAVCGRCDFCPWCIPDVTKAQGIIDRLDDEALNAECQIFWEMADPRKAYEDANKRIGDHLKAILADDGPGTTKTIVTTDFGIVAKKTAKSVTKKILPLSELVGGSSDD